MIGKRVKAEFGTGTVTASSPYGENTWWVLWETGDHAGKTYWGYGDDLTIIESEFKVGSSVRERATGDTGWIAEMYPDSTVVRVDWLSGSCSGMVLSITLPELELVVNTEKQIAPDLDGETIVLSGVEYRLVKI